MPLLKQPTQVLKLKNVVWLLRCLLNSFSIIGDFFSSFLPNIFPRNLFWVKLIIIFFFYVIQFNPDGLLPLSEQDVEEVLEDIRLECARSLRKHFFFFFLNLGPVLLFFKNSILLSNS
jgi:hypothetical protein